jgi:hypothetical protein
LEQFDREFDMGQFRGMDDEMLRGYIKALTDTRTRLEAVGEEGRKSPQLKEAETTAKVRTGVRD